MKRAPFLVVSAIGAVLVAVALGGPWLGLGWNEDFLAYRLAGVSRSQLTQFGAVLAALPLIVLAAASGASHRALSWLATTSRRGAGPLRASLSSLRGDLDGRVARWILGGPDGPPSQVSGAWPHLASAALSVGWAVFGLAALNPDMDAAEFAVAANVLTGRTVPVPGSIIAWIAPALLTQGSRLVAALMSLTGLSAYQILLACSPVLVFSGLMSIHWGTSRLAGNPLAGLCAVAVLPGSWVNDMVVGFHMSFWNANVTAANWGIVGTVIVLAVWLNGPRSGWRRLVPWALAGGVFCLHNTFGAIVAVALVLGEALDFGVSIAVRLRGMALGGGAFLLASSPQLLTLAGAVSTLQTSPPGEDWWNLMILRKHFHVFLWSNFAAPHSFRLALQLAVTFALTTTLAWQLLESWTRARLLATGVAALALGLVSYGAAEVVVVPTLMGLVLSRSMLLPAYALLIVLCALPNLSLRRPGRVPAFVLLCSLALPPLLAFGPGPALPGLLTIAVLLAATVHLWRGGGGIVTLLGGVAIALWPASSDDKRIMLAITAMLAVAVLALLTGRKVEAEPTGEAMCSVRRLRVVGSAIAIIVAGLLVIKAAKLQRAAASNALTPAWNQAIHWLRDHTKPDALLLMPPYPYSEITLGRSHIMSYLFMGFSIYARNALAYELDQLKLLYDIDLRAMSREQVWGLVWKPGPLCLVEKGYARTVSDRERLQAVSREHPQVSYVLAPLPGVTPPQWSCGPADTRRLDLPVVFTNSDYVVYDISGIAPR